MAKTAMKGTPQITVSLGPWKGVRDIGDAGEQSPEFAQDAVNCVFQGQESGAADVGQRLGFSQLSTTAFGSRQIQLFHTHVDSTGTVRNFVVANGKLYRAGADLTTWTDVTPGGFGFNNATGARVWACSFGDELIFNDQAQRPQRCTNLTSTPVTLTSIQYDSSSTDWRALGQPTVYAGKLFFIVYEYPAATGIVSRITWSEELSSSTGYAQTGYTNFWSLSYGGSGRIYHLLGTNIGLYYFRANSIGMVSGAVNSTFTTGSTHDTVSSTVGTGATYIEPLLTPNNYVYFTDNMLRLHRFPLGGRVDESSEIWRQMRYRLRLMASDSGTINSGATFGRLAYHTDAKKVVFTMGNEDGTSTKPGRTMYVFDALRGTYEGRWIIGNSPPTTETAFAATFIECMGELIDPATLYRRFMVGGSDGFSSTYTVNTSGGCLYEQKWHAETATPYADDNGTQQARITVPAYNSTSAELWPSQVRLRCKTGTTSPTITLKYYSSRTNGSSALSATPTAASDATQTVDDGGSINREDFLRARAVWGVGADASGTWLKLVFTGSSSGRNQFAFEKGEVLAALKPVSPGSY